MAGGFCIGGIDTYAERVCRRRRDRGELTNARSALVGVAETGGMNQCTQCVGWRRRDRGRVLKERGTLSLMTFGTFGHAKVR